MLAARCPPIPEVLRYHLWPPGGPCCGRPHHPAAAVPALGSLQPAGGVQWVTPGYRWATRVVCSSPPSLSLLSFFGSPAPGDKHLRVRVPATRLALFTGSLVGLYHGSHCLLEYLRKSEEVDSPQKGAVLGLPNSVLAGAVAGASLVYLVPETRRTLSLYLLTRLGQCVYNELKRRGIIKPVWHGDTLLFGLASAQVMCKLVFGSVSTSDLISEHPHKV